MNLAARTNTKVVSAGVAAGVTKISASLIDMQGWDGCYFVFLFGALTAGQVTVPQVYGGQQSGGGDQAQLPAAVANALADADSNLAVVIDVYRPSQRYLGAVVARGTQNAVLQGIIAIQYQGRRQPPASTADGTTPYAAIDASIVQELVVADT